MNNTVESKRNLVHRALASLGALKTHKRPAMTTAVTALTLTAAGILVVAGLISPSASRANDISAVQADNIFGDLADNEVKTFTVDAALGVHYYQNSIDPAENAQNPAPFSPGDTFFKMAPSTRKVQYRPGKILLI